MKQVLVGRYRAPLLMDELLAAFPAWRGELAPEGLRLPPGARVNALLIVRKIEGGVVLEFPDDADTVAVDAVIAAHNPDFDTPGDVARRARRQAILRLKANPAQLAADLVLILGL